MLLPLAVAAPLVAAALLPLLGRRFGRGVALPAAAVLAGVAAALGREVPAVLDGGVTTWSRPWLPDAGVALALRLDALGLLFALVVTVVGVLVMLYAWRYFEADDPAAVRTVALLSLFAAAMLGVVLADDVILLFVAWELTSITSFFLIGGDGTKGAAGARRALLVTALGGLALLAAAVLLIQAAGTTSLAGILAAGPEVRAAGTAAAMVVLVALAAGTKSAQVPFQFWLPGAMVAPTPVSTYLHAATMVKAGVYLLLRLAPAFQGLPLWHGTLVLVGGTTAVLGAWVAVTRRDLKALMAYSTVSQLGLLVALVGLGTPLALGTAGLHVLAHALFKAALFMSVGVVDHATGTRDLDRLGGLGRALPGTAVAAALAAAGMAGLPPR
ncbi:MAG: NADH-quinone oxidoreductase subunit L, partial [Nitriliruptoraceae bacterium]